jgi:hypothetical protein
MLTNTTNNNTQKYTDNELRDDWDARIENAQHHTFKRRHAAVIDEPDTAKRDALWVWIAAQRHHWFSAELERSVTKQALLVIEFLDYVHACAKRPLAQQMLLFLQRCILESAALAPYLERWRWTPLLPLLLLPALARAAPIGIWKFGLKSLLCCSLCLFSWQRLSLVHHHRRRAASCIYDARISTTGKKDMDPGASSSAGLWAARAPPVACGQ